MRISWQQGVKCAIYLPHAPVTEGPRPPPDPQVVNEYYRLQSYAGKPVFFHGISYGENYVANINWVLSIEKVQGWKERSIDWMENLLLFVACRKCSIWTPPPQERHNSWNFRFKRHWTIWIESAVKKEKNNFSLIGMNVHVSSLFYIRSIEKL